MKKKILLLGWVSSYDDHNKNFGDELSPFIVHKLSGADVLNVPVITSRARLILMIIKRTALMSWRDGELFVFLKLLFGAKYLLALGSILQFYKFNRAIVWGTGLISKDAQVGNNQYHAVRGPLTRAELLKKGYDVPEIYGDPAILLPWLINKSVKINYLFGFVPHVAHLENFKLEYNFENNLIIKLATGNIDKVINEIRSCKYIVSSSLHGLIVAHAFGIVALWFNLGSDVLLGDNMKFEDYFLSVGIEPYKPFDIKSITSEEQLINLFMENKNLSLHQNDMNKMAKQLLRAAPFDLEHTYLDMIK